MCAHDFSLVPVLSALPLEEMDPLDYLLELAAEFPGPCYQEGVLLPQVPRFCSLLLLLLEQGGQESQ